MDDVTFALVMVREPDVHPYVKDFETWLRDALHARYGPAAQLQILGPEDEAIQKMWKVRQRILERRQADSRS